MIPVMGLHWDMRWNLLGGWVMLGLSLPPAFADVVDDLGVPEQQFLRALSFAGRPMRPGAGPARQVFLDLPLSDAHLAAIKTELRDNFFGGKSSFLESRADFAGALESKRLHPLDRARLLVRAGRLEDARAFLAGDEMLKSETSENPIHLLPGIFRPLENSAAWDDLHAFLKLLGERFDSPQWRAALWAEELDVAWHLDQLPALLEQNAQSPLRLAFFHHRLGNITERDALVTGLLENAPPGRVVELLELMRNCPLISDAALRLWESENVPDADRTGLFKALAALPESGNFNNIFFAWLEKNRGGILLADAIWKQWAPTAHGNDQRTGIFDALVRHHPEEPRFRLLLGRQLLKSDSVRAVEQFKEVASLPLQTTAQPAPYSWQREDLNIISEDLRDDFAGIAILGLGILNRQDLISTILDQHPGWRGLPPIDQARYLTLGKMDFALAKLVLDADFSNPGNDSLAGALRVSWESRLTKRTLPLEIAERFREKFDTIVAGSPEKNSNAIADEAQAFLKILTASLATGWKEPVERLIAVSDKRDATKTENLKKQILSATTGNAEIVAVFSKDAMPEVGQTTGTSAETMSSHGILALFAPPEIRRIPPDEDTRRISGFRRPFGISSEKLPWDLLPRWIDNSDFRRPAFESMTRRPLSGTEQAAIRSIMRTLGVGNPRRLVAEILIAEGLIDCEDDVLKAESQASYQAFLGGTSKESRGSEAFRYRTLAAKTPVNQDALQGISDSLKSLPPSVADATRPQLAGQRPGNPMMNRRPLQEPGRIAPRQTMPPLQQDEDLAKLRKLVDEKLAGAPETVELAKHLLNKAVQLDSKAQSLENYYPAIQVLTRSMDAWVKETREKLRSAGIPELEILLRLQKIDQWKDADGHDRGLGYAREILALDSSSDVAAKKLIGTAAREGDQKLVLICLRALDTDGLDYLAHKETLRVFSKEDAPKVLALVKEFKTTSRLPENEKAASLTRYFLDADPMVAADFFSWLAAQGASSDSDRIQIVSQLLDAGQKDLAVEIEARAFAAPRDYPGQPFQFPPKPGVNPSRESSPKTLSGLAPDLDLLRTRKLFGEVIARMEVLGNVDPLVLATFRLVETPDIPTFERYALPALASAGPSYMRRGALRNWEELFANHPISSALRLRFLEEKSAVSGNRLEDISNSIELIKSAAGLPGSSPLIARLWEQISKAISATPEPDQKEINSSRAYEILQEMLISADDDTWRSYWSWREQEPKELANSNNRPFVQAFANFAAPSRIRQILPRVIKDLKGSLPPEQAERWALAAVAAGDPVILEKIKALIPNTPDAGAATTLCELGLGETGKASLVSDAAPEENGETLLWWGFVGIGVHGIPRSPFATLDGRFDLQITAGESPDRQELVTKLSAIPASGHLRLKLTPRQSCVSMIATDPKTGATLVSKPVDLKKRSSNAISLTDEGMREKGFEKSVFNGPGDLPAWKIRFSKGERIDLIDRLWNGRESVSIGAWTSGKGRLQLRCFDADGRQLETEWRNDQNRPDFPLPVWQFSSYNHPLKATIPGETVRLVLSVCENSDYQPFPDFAFSSPRVEFGEPAPLPEGFEHITRVPGTASVLVISPDGRHLAVVFKNGKIVTLDPSTRQMTEIVKSGISEKGQNNPALITWTTAGLRVLQPDGILYRLDDSGTKLDTVIDLQKKSESRNSLFQISSDAKWVISMKSYGRFTLTATDGSVSREISDLDTSRFEFTDEGLLFFLDRQNVLLKTSDFATGTPVPTEPKPPRPDPSAPWGNRIRYGSGGGDRHIDYRRNDEGRLERTDVNHITIPASPKTTAYAEDGTLYYIDGAGNIVRGVVSPR